MVRSRKKKKPKIPRITFTEGDLVEFWSSEHGGMWKPATISEWVTHCDNITDETRAEITRFVRLQVGPKVYIIREKTKVRLRVT